MFHNSVLQIVEYDSITHLEVRIKGGLIYSVNINFLEYLEIWNEATSWSHVFDPIHDLRPIYPGFFLEIKKTVDKIFCI